MMSIRNLVISMVLQFIPSETLLFHCLTVMSIRNLAISAVWLTSAKQTKNAKLLSRVLSKLLIWAWLCEGLNTLEETNPPTLWAKRRCCFIGFTIRRFQVDEIRDSIIKQHCWFELGFVMVWTLLRNSAIFKSGLNMWQPPHPNPYPEKRKPGKVRGI